MKYRNYRVRLVRGGASEEHINMAQFLAHINAKKEKIMHIIAVGTDGWHVDIITLGQDDD